MVMSYPFVLISWGYHRDVGELPTDRLGRLGGAQFTLVISMGFLWGQVVHVNN